MESKERHSLAHGVSRGFRHLPLAVPLSRSCGEGRPEDAGRGEGLQVPGLAPRAKIFRRFAALQPGAPEAQGKFELVTGQDFERAVPKDFYPEGNAIPTEKRNSVLLKTPSNPRVLIGLIDTTGYSSQIKKKYIGMLTEGELSLNGQKVSVGSYGFGLEKPVAGSSGDGKVMVYNQAGTQTVECAARRDADLKQPRPLQIVLGKDGARLYIERYWVEIQ